MNLREIGKIGPSRSVFKSMGNYYSPYGQLQLNAFEPTIGQVDIEELRIE